MSGVTYAGYLRLPELLGAIRPLSPPGDRRVHSAEHFFIVAHQASELWLRQVLVDLDLAVHAVDDGQPEVGAVATARAAAALRLLAEHVGLLRALSPRDFANFRQLLGQASGAHSGQFRSVRRALGLEGGDGPLWTVLVTAAEDRGHSVSDLYTSADDSDPLFRLAEAMVELSQAYWTWQVVHVEVVRRSIGNARGTGRTSGAEYLAGRLGAPFPELWEARSLLHESSTVPLPR